MRQSQWVMAAALLSVTGCSDDSGETAESIVPSTISSTAASVAEATTTSTVVRVPQATSTVSAPNTTIDVGLPPVDPATVDATKTAIADPGVSVWLSSAVAIAEVAEGSRCSAAAPTMDPVVASRVIAFEDPVLSELLVNLDGALGGLQLACANGDDAAAASELADAKAAAIAVSTRIDELSR